MRDLFWLIFISAVVIAYVIADGLSRIDKRLTAIQQDIRDRPSERSIMLHCHACDQEGYARNPEVHELFKNLFPSNKSGTG